MVRSIVLGLAILLAGPELVGAQSADTTFSPGTRVRIRASGSPTLIGTVARHDSSGLVLIRDAGDTVAVPRETAGNIEISQGRRSNKGKGAARGAMIGGIVGALAGVLSEADDCGGQGCFFDYGPEVIPLSALGGAFFGGTIGFLIGSLSKSERWGPPRSDLEVIGRGASAGGVHLGLAVSF